MRALLTVRPRLRQRVCARLSVRHFGSRHLFMQSRGLALLVICQHPTLQSLHAGSQPNQGMETSRSAGAGMRTADRSQAAMQPPSVRGRSTGPATAGASRLARLAAERRQQGAQEGTDGRSPRFGLAPTPTPTPSRASSAESGSAVGSSSQAGAAKSGALDVTPQELSRALEQATESSSSAAAAAGRDTGRLSSAGRLHA